MLFLELCTFLEDSNLKTCMGCLYPNLETLVKEEFGPASTAKLSGPFVRSDIASMVWNPWSINISKFISGQAESMVILEMDDDIPADYSPHALRSWVFSQFRFVTTLLLPFRFKVMGAASVVGAPILKVTICCCFQFRLFIRRFLTYIISLAADGEWQNSCSGVEPG